MENFIFLCSLKDRDKRSAQSDIYDVACFAKTLNHTCLATSKIRLCIAIMRAVKLIIEVLFTGMITIFQSRSVFHCTKNEVFH